MINFKIFFVYNTKQHETILTNFVSDHFSYPSVINPNKMSYFWSIHKRLRGSWIGHIEGPWSLSCLMTSFYKTIEQIFLWKCLMEILDIKFFFMKSSKTTCAVSREEFPPVRLNSHRHVARQQIFIYSPLACNNNNWFFSFSLNISLAPDCCNCLQHFMYFLCLPPSGPLSTGMQGQKSLFDTFWAFFGHFCTV